MHRSSYDKMARFARQYLNPDENLTIVDLGSYDVSGAYRPIFEPRPAWRYIGVDVVAGPNVDIVLRDPYDWKEIEDESVDVLVSGQALEHIEFFWLTMEQIRRKLKVGGLCCLVAPSSGREHRYPVDCWRFYPDGFRALAKWARLEPIEVFTQWEDDGYTDGGEEYHDTFGLFRKTMPNRRFMAVRRSAPDNGLPEIWAFYLPQFHRIPENDQWWGDGFTEWTHARTARPLFPEHRQPHEPGELGYYDLRDPEIMGRQAELARRYGITGFVFYHYWFMGRRLLETPVRSLLERGKPAFPFCFCWANENWSRRWDGKENDVLMRQEYSPEDDEAHIHALLPAFKDQRYLKRDGCPVLLVYRSEDIPDPERTADLWRREAVRAGFDGLRLIRVEGITADIDPADHGMDAAVEFAPDWRCCRRRVFWGPEGNWSDTSDGAEPGTVENSVFLYDEVTRCMNNKPETAWKRYPGVFPGWDNTARRQKIKGATVLHGNTPERYGEFLEETLMRAVRRLPPGDRMVFLNAWNEWGEGCHLEPDARCGDAYLRATAETLAAVQAKLAARPELDPWRESGVLQRWLDRAKHVLLRRRFRSDGAS